jgi:hypothetical protein
MTVCEQRILLVEVRGQCLRLKFTICKNTVIGRAACAVNVRVRCYTMDSQSAARAPGALQRDRSDVRQEIK